MGDCATEKVTDGKSHVEVFVGVFVVQEVMASHKLIGSPVCEETLFWLMHLKVNLIPNRVVQSDYTWPDCRADKKCLIARQIARHSKQQAQRQALEQALPEIEPNAPVFARRQWLVVEVLPILISPPLTIKRPPKSEV